MTEAARKISNPRAVRIRRDLARVRRLLRAAASDPAAARAKVIAGVARYANARIAPPVATNGRPELPAFSIPSGPVARPDLPVAVILDPFSELAYRYEWNQIMITPYGWRPRLEAHPPALLFVESAWNGNRGSWRLAMSTHGGPTQSLQDLVSWCRARAIPTVFWNKEDPPNYDRFLDTARLFDHVFTVDANRIDDYRRDLGHNRIGLLPFAAQPRVHNPVLRGHGRKHDVAFAGTYFVNKHPERRAQMDYLLSAATDMGLHIYSRMENNADSRYRFPDHLRQFVVGSLEYEAILAAYTSYKVFLNVNSVTQSPTMCARRLFELSAAQTAVLTAPAASIEPFFGDSLTVADSDETAVQAIRILVDQREHRDRLALRAHRRVFDEHLYTHRVQQVLSAVGIVDAVPSTGTISAVVPTKRPEQLANVMAYIGAQQSADLELILVTHGFEADSVQISELAERFGVRSYRLLPADSALTLGACMNLGIAAADGQYVAKMDDDNWYGPHYLSDLVRAFSWTDAQVVGKWAHYVHLQRSNATLLRFPDAEHRYVNLVQGGTIVAPRSVLRDCPMENLPRAVDTTFLEKVRRIGGKVYSADRFNFVSIRSGASNGHTWSISDEDLLVRKSSLLFYGAPQAHAEV
ncbi:MAG TPA: glycosyltransferase [Propionibacteriaceae bacterium]|nr:glycosyltransferase [Propionibacteriaceae bacterium]